MLAFPTPSGRRRPADASPKESLKREAMTTTAPEVTRSDSALERWFRISRARLDGRARGPRRAGDVLHDGVHRRAQPAHHRHPDRQHDHFSAAPRAPAAAIPMVAAATALVAGVMTILMGVVGELPARARHRPRPERLRRLRDRQAARMTWADAMGLVVIEGLIILVLVLTGLPDGGLQRRPRAAQDRDQRGHRPVHRDHRLRRRRLRPADRRRDRCPSSSASAATSPAGRRSCSCSACC